MRALGVEVRSIHSKNTEEIATLREVTVYVELSSIPIRARAKAYGCEASRRLVGCIIEIIYGKHR